MRDVAVIGIGMTKWGELWEKSLRDIYVETALLALDDAGIDRIDSMYIGSMSSGLFVELPVPATRVETACASGGLALRLGFMEVASGMSDIVLASGVEKMTDVGGNEATYALGTAADQEYEGYQGITFPGLYALIARAHMQKYGTTREQLNILDCSPITDGAAAAIICPLDMARKMGKPLIKIIGTGHATDTIQICQRKDMTWLEATYQAAKQAYAMADKKPEDIDFIEVHDCFTIAEICATEALGIVDKGKGGEAVESGLTDLEGKIPVNTSGGLKSKGHPVGATGIAQIVEVTKQLRGEAGERQVKDARVGMTQNMGGSGGSSVVHILERE